MDCSPAGMFLSRPGACSEPTSFFNAENMFLLDVRARLACKRGWPASSAAAVAKRTSHHVRPAQASPRPEQARPQAGARRRARPRARFWGLSLCGSAPASTALGEAARHPSAPPSWPRRGYGTLKGTRRRRMRRERTRSRPFLASPHCRHHPCPVQQSASPSSEFRGFSFL